MMNAPERFLIGAGIVVLACAVITGIVVWYLYYNKMNPSGKHDINTVRVDCTSCTSGTQAWSNGQWGPIPMDMRMVQDGVMTFEAPLANARKCNKCMGRGWFPKDVK